MTLTPDFTTAQGETNKTWQDTLLDGAGNPINLSTALAVKMLWRDATNMVVVNAAAVIVNAAGGVVSYKPVAADVANAGAYQAQWLVTWSDLTTTYVPDGANKLFALVTAKVA